MKEITLAVVIAGLWVGALSTWILDYDDFDSARGQGQSAAGDGAGRGAAARDAIAPNYLSTDFPFLSSVDEPPVGFMAR